MCTTLNRSWRSSNSPHVLGEVFLCIIRFGHGEPLDEHLNMVIEKCYAKVRKPAGDPGDVTAVEARLHPVAVVATARAGWSGSRSAP
jgi:hypothetical protein